MSRDSFSPSRVILKYLFVLLMMTVGVTALSGVFNRRKFPRKRPDYLNTPEPSDAVEPDGQDEKQGMMIDPSVMGAASSRQLLSGATNIDISAGGELAMQTTMFNMTTTDALAIVEISGGYMVLRSDPTVTWQSGLSLLYHEVDNYVLKAYLGSVTVGITYLTSDAPKTPGTAFFVNQVLQLHRCTFTGKPGEVIKILPSMMFANSSLGEVVQYEVVGQNNLQNELVSGGPRLRFTQQDIAEGTQQLRLNLERKQTYFVVVLNADGLYSERLLCNVNLPPEANILPTVSPIPQVMEPGQAIPLQQLFSVGDPDGLGGLTVEIVHILHASVNVGFFSMSRISSVELRLDDSGIKPVIEGIVYDGDDQVGFSLDIAVAGIPQLLAPHISVQQNSFTVIEFQASMEGVAANQIIYDNFIFSNDGRSNGEVRSTANNAILNSFTQQNITQGDVMFVAGPENLTPFYRFDIYKLGSSPRKGTYTVGISFFNEVGKVAPSAQQNDIIVIDEGGDVVATLGMFSVLNGNGTLLLDAQISFIASQDIQLLKIDAITGQYQPVSNVMLADVADGLVTLRHPGSEGDASFSWQAVDSEGLSSTLLPAKVVTIKINDPPLYLGTSSFVGSQNPGYLSFDCSDQFSDSDSVGLVYSRQSLNDSILELFWDPNTGIMRGYLQQPGSYFFTCIADDGEFQTESFHEVRVNALPSDDTLQENVWMDFLTERAVPTMVTGVIIAIILPLLKRYAEGHLITLATQRANDDNATFVDRVVEKVIKSLKVKASGFLFVTTWDSTYQQLIDVIRRVVEGIENNLGCEMKDIVPYQQEDVLRSIRDALINQAVWQPERSCGVRANDGCCKKAALFLPMKLWKLVTYLAYYRIHHRWVTREMGGIILDVCRVWGSKKRTLAAAMVKALQAKNPDYNVEDFMDRHKDMLAMRDQLVFTNKRIDAFQLVPMLPNSPRLGGKTFNFEYKEDSDLSAVEIFLPEHDSTGHLMPPPGMSPRILSLSGAPDIGLGSSDYIRKTAFTTGGMIKNVAGDALGQGNFVDVDSKKESALDCPKVQRRASLEGGALYYFSSGNGNIVKPRRSKSSAQHVKNENSASVPQHVVLHQNVSHSSMQLALFNSGRIHLSVVKHLVDEPSDDSDDVLGI